MSSKFSIIFDPRADNLQTVLADVTQMFAIFGALTGAAAATEDTAGDSPTNETHDSTGLPWDARIHADPRSLTKGKVWRAKRNVSKELVAQVEAELRGQQPAVSQAAVQNGGIQNATIQPLATLAAPAPLAALAPAAAPSTYDHLVKLVGDNMAPAGRMTQEWLTGALGQFGVAGSALPNVRSMPEDAQVAIYTAIKAALAG